MSPCREWFTRFKYIDATNLNDKLRKRCNIKCRQPDIFCSRGRGRKFANSNASQKFQLAENILNAIERHFNNLKKCLRKLWILCSGWFFELTKLQICKHYERKHDKLRHIPLNWKGIVIKTVKVIKGLT